MIETKQREKIGNVRSTSSVPSLISRSKSIVHMLYTSVSIAGEALDGRAYRILYYVTEWTWKDREVSKRGECFVWAASLLGKGYPHTLRLNYSGSIVSKGFVHARHLDPVFLSAMLTAPRSWLCGVRRTADLKI